MGFPGGPLVKNLPPNGGDIGSIPSPGKPHMHRTATACVPQLLSQCSRDCKLQLLKPACREPVHCNKRSPQITERAALLPGARESPCTAMKA